MAADLPTKTPTDAQRFASIVDAIARTELSKLAEANPERFGEAAARVPLALRAAVNSAKDPGPLLRMAATNAASVGACVALSALTGIMPGGAYPGCYLIPMDGALQWWINHRGILALARRVGINVQVIPHYEGDHWVFRQGMRPEMDHQRGSGPATFETLVGIGVLVTERGQFVGMMDVERSDIIARRGKSRSGSVWSNWPIEMAMKTAVKMAVARGLFSLDDVGQAAIAGDMDTDAETHSAPAQTRPRIPLPEPRQIAPTLDEPSEADRAAALAEEMAAAGGK